MKAKFAGTLGVLKGAELLNLRKIPMLGALVASVGGGTFDRVFLSGINSSTPRQTVETKKSYFFGIKEEMLKRASKLYGSQISLENGYARAVLGCRLDANCLKWRWAG